jgi:V8-like Glu-specific endopeptidase
VARSSFEKLIGDNNLRPVGFLAQGLRRSTSVCLVEVAGFGSGTGFLVGPGVLVTNNHVIPSAEHAQRTRARFNYEADVDGRLKASEYFAARPDVVFHTNPQLDYTLVYVDGQPETRYGVLPIVPAPVSVGMRVNIIQHPGGEPKQLAIVDNEVEYADTNVMQYLTDTLPGSSGSPVFDDQWNLVALHHSGGWIPEPSTSSTHFRNEGVLISAIVADMRSVGLAH